MDIVRLNNNFELPVMGMGTYPLRGKILLNSVVNGLNFGYRLFDTAHAYPNEKDLGEAFRYVYKHLNISRSEIFITSKIGENLDRGKGDGKLFCRTNSVVEKNIHKIVVDQFNDSLYKLQTDYLDVLLIHWPYPDFLIDIWFELEELYLSGRVKSIGVSNCRERHLKKILEECRVKPMINQVEISPLNTRKSLIQFCKANQIQVEVYSPLMSLSRKELREADCIKQITERYQKSIAQILLRWNIQQGLIPIPKSAKSSHLKSNVEVFDFALSKEEMLAIDNLNINYQYLPESIFCPGY